MQQQQQASAPVSRESYIRELEERMAKLQEEIEIKKLKEQKTKSIGAEPPAPDAEPSRPSRSMPLLRFALDKDDMYEITRILILPRTDDAHLPPLAPLPKLEEHEERLRKNLTTFVEGLVETKYQWEETYNGMRTSGRLPELSDLNTWMAGEEMFTEDARLRRVLLGLHEVSWHKAHIDHYVHKHMLKVVARRRVPRVVAAAVDGIGDAKKKQQREHKKQAKKRPAAADAAAAEEEEMLSEEVLKDDD